MRVNVRVVSVVLGRAGTQTLSADEAGGSLPPLRGPPISSHRSSGSSDEAQLAVKLRREEGGLQDVGLHESRKEGNAAQKISSLGSEQGAVIKEREG